MMTGLALTGVVIERWHLETNAKICSPCHSPLNLRFAAATQSPCVSADFPATGLRDRHHKFQSAEKPCHKVVLAISQVPLERVA